MQTLLPNNEVSAQYSHTYQWDSQQPSSFCTQTHRCNGPVSMSDDETWQCSIIVNKITFKEHKVCPMLCLTLFKIFPSKYTWATTLTFQGHVTSPVTWPFFSPGAISYKCSIVLESVLPAIFGDNGSQAYWGHDLELSRSHYIIGHVTKSIRHVPFHIGVTLQPSLYLQPFLRCSTSKTRACAHTDTCCRWFYILSDAMYCTRQTITLCVCGADTDLDTSWWMSDSTGRQVCVPPSSSSTSAMLATSATVSSSCGHLTSLLSLQFSFCCKLIKLAILCMSSSL